MSFETCRDEKMDGFPPPLTSQRRPSGLDDRWSDRYGRKLHDRRIGLVYGFWCDSREKDSPKLRRETTATNITITTRSDHNTMVVSSMTTSNQLTKTRVIQSAKIMKPDHNKRGRTSSGASSMLTWLMLTALALSLNLLHSSNCLELTGDGVGSQVGQQHAIRVKSQHTTYPDNLSSSAPSQHSTPTTISIDVRNNNKSNSRLSVQPLTTSDTVNKANIDHQHHTKSPHALALTTALATAATSGSVSTTARTASPRDLATYSSLQQQQVAPVASASTETMVASDSKKKKKMIKKKKKKMEKKHKEWKKGKKHKKKKYESKKKKGGMEKKKKGKYSE